MDTRGSIYGVEGVDEVSMVSSDTLHESLRYVRYIMFYILEYLLANIYIYYNDASNKWKQLQFYQFLQTVTTLPYASKTYPILLLRI